ncbi:RHS repeat domain-containing protein [Flavobacterium procerum]|uniref:RHS repeat domain-containing protein n=1 Tax=Flavobacterium procerum TaxID=1455569 RepID=A0ABV6BPX4_9FLAO
MEYIAFGEVLFEEHSSSFSSPYLFNGKELDRETNLSYYGARYLDMKTSLWLNVDPLAEKMPGYGAYVYAFNSPVCFIDPDGKEPKYRYENINKNTKYGTILVLPMNFKSDPALKADYDAAKKQKMPIIMVSGTVGLKNSLKNLKKQNVNYNAISISQHGNKGFFQIGDNSQYMSSESKGGNTYSFTTPQGNLSTFQTSSFSEFNYLKDVLKGKLVFIGECLVTKDNDKQAMSMIQNFTNATQSTTFTSDHSVPGGYSYTGNDTFLNNNNSTNGYLWWKKYEDGDDYNDYHLFKPNSKSKEIYDLKIRLNGTFIWNKNDGK